jgi:hypothetical protein
MDLEQYLSHITELGNNLEKTVEKLILKNSGKIRGPIKLRLLQKGLDGNLNSLGTYSKRHALLRKSKGLNIKFVTLRYEGDFFDSWEVKAKGFSFFVDSDDFKAPLLEKRYGDAIMQMTEQEVEIFVDSVIEPQLNEIIRNFGNSIDI